MIFLTAPLDVQRTPAYEAALKLLTERHGPDQVIADRELFSSMKEYNKVWKSVYDPENADRLYVLAREDGTIGSGVYRQYKRLCKKHGVPSTLFLAEDNEVAEAAEFTVTLIEEADRDERYFALVSPIRLADGGASGFTVNTGKAQD